jgi:hypothetical protein
MKLVCKMIALTLLVAAVSPVFPQAYAAAVRQPAGCHEHGQKAPPSPVTYQCCTAGHQFAAVREAPDFRSPLLQLSPTIRIALPALAEPSRQDLWQPWLLALGSPGLISLRI